MKVNFEQLESGKSYVITRRGGYYGDRAMVFEGLYLSGKSGNFDKVFLRDIESGEEVGIPCLGIVDIQPLTREWLEARMLAIAAEVAALQFQSSNLLDARKALSCSSG